MSNFKGQAVNTHIVLKEVAIENVTDSGLDISSSEDRNQKFKKGIVVSVGLQCPKNSDGSEILKIGDEIFFDGYKGTPLTIDAEVYTIIYFQDVTIIL